MDLGAADAVTALHERELERRYAGEIVLDVDVRPPAAIDDELEAVVRAQHEANCNLWDLEDEARRRGVGDSHIASVKRAIDAWNQRRNDLIEAIDAAVLRTVGAKRPPGAEQHSETAGMMADRLSILALKIHHMRSYAERAGDDAALERECRAKLCDLHEQRDDLARCLSKLIDDVRAGRRYFKVYRQHKAYNDPRLNPAYR